MNTGTLYGVGIGPGDPKLMTFRAAELIRDNEIIALPGEKAEETVAYQIACLLYTSPSPRDGLLARMPSSA